jgi:hypothetical protein
MCTYMYGLEGLSSHDSVIYASSFLQSYYLGRVVLRRAD